MSETKYKQSMPVFRLHPTNTDSGRIRYIGCFTDKEKLLDEKLDLDLSTDSKYFNIEYGKDTLYLGKIIGYDVTIELFKCNLTGSFVIDNTEYPLFYFNICYKNNFIRGGLMEYYFTFTMTDKCKKELDNPKKYNGAYVDGNYSFGLNISEKINKNYKNMLKSLFTERNTSMDCENYDINDVNVEQYNYFFERSNYVGDYITLTKIKNHMLDICYDTKLLDIIEIAIKLREQERREEAGIDSDDEFNIPDPEKVIVISNKEEVNKKFKDILTL